MSTKEITIQVTDADIPLRDVAGIVAKVFGGEPVSRQAVYQWTEDGRKGKDGQLVKLQTAKKRGRKHTKLAWIKTFVEAL